MAQDTHALPTELWLEIAAFVLSSDPECLSLSSLARTCLQLYAVCRPFIHKKMLEDFQYCAAGVHPRLNTLKVRLRSSHPPYALQCLRHGIKHYNWDAKGVEGRSCGFDTVDVELDGREPDVPVLASVLSTCVQNTRKLTVKEVKRWGTDRKDKPEDYPFQVVCACLKAGSGGITSSTQTPSSWMVSTISRLSQRLLATTGTISEPHTHTWTVKPLQPRYNLRLPPIRLKLTDLHLESTELFSVSMYPWTCYILKTAALSRLSIHVKLSVYHWANILPSLHLPALEDLQIGNIDLAFENLLQFLVRHPNLRALDLSLNSAIGVVDFGTYPDRLSFLPLLETLRAAPEYILPFLNQIDYISKLRTLDLMPCRFYRYELTNEGERDHRDRFFHPVFNSLSQANQEKHLHVELHHTALTSLIEWMFSGDSEVMRHDEPDVSFLRRLSAVQKITIVDLVATMPRIQLPDYLVRWSIKHSGVFGLDLEALNSTSPVTRFSVVEKLLLLACPNVDPANLQRVDV